MELVGVEFSGAVESLFSSWLPARSLVAQAIDSRLQVRLEGARLSCCSALPVAYSYLMRVHRMHTRLAGARERTHRAAGERRVSLEGAPARRGGRASPARRRVAALRPLSRARRRRRLLVARACGARRLTLVRVAVQLLLFDSHCILVTLTTRSSHYGEGWGFCKPVPIFFLGGGRGSPMYILFCLYYEAY